MAAEVCRWAMLPLRSCQCHFVVSLLLILAVPIGVWQRLGGAFTASLRASEVACLFVCVAICVLLGHMPLLVFCPLAN